MAYFLLVIAKDHMSNISKVIGPLSFVLFSSMNSVWAQTDSPYKSSSAARHSGQVYHVKNIIDIPLTAATVGWSLYGMSKIYGRDTVPVWELARLQPDKINAFDRPIADNYDEKARKASDKFFYGSMPLPMFLLFDKRIRKDAAKVGLIYLEAMGITGTIYTGAAMSANRFRPYAYNTSVPLAKRTRGGARNSFYAGHPSVVATGTFFMAKVYTDYHPEMKAKWALFATAGALTATTGFLRLKAGQHFRTDVITGVTMGTLSGILVPQIHKNKDYDKRKWSFYPNMQGGSNGITALYKIR